MTMMFIGLTLLFYHYYDFSLAVNHFAPLFNHKNNIPLTFIMTLAPFTFSALFCPVGGLIVAWWQRKSANYVFPYLFLVDSVLCILSNFIIRDISLPNMLVLASFFRIIQGFLLGGMLPQYVIYFYDKSHNVQQQVGYSTLFFITFYLCSILSIITVNFTAPDVSILFNWIISLLYLGIAIIIFSYKKIWHNFHIDGLKINHSWSFIHTWRANYWTMIRFACFITFMASINGFFLTVMPFFLIHDLNYDKDSVFIMQIIMMIVGILGFLVGSIYHAKIGRKIHLTIGLIIKGLIFILFKLYFNHSIFWIDLIGSLCLFSFGVMAAKILLMLNSVFCTQSRLFGISFTYNISWGLMFGFSGYLTMLLIVMFHNLYIPSMIVLLFSYVSLVSLWFTPGKDFFRYLD
jgi:MFS family permease